MSNLLKHATRELYSIGMLGCEDEMNREMSECVLDLLEVFAGQGHTGFSAPYAIGLFTKLANFEALSPLTGDDSEWFDLSEYGDPKMKYQNIRCGSVFKNADGSVYDIDGRVFESPDGSRYTSKDSNVPVIFPYTPNRIVVKVDDLGVTIEGV